MTQPRFSIFYANGAVVTDDGEDTEVVFRVPKAWMSAPTDGVQFVVRHLPDGKMRVYEQRESYFVLANGEPVANDDGPAAMLRAAGVLKHGLWIPDSEFEAIRDLVRAYRARHE